MLTVFFFLVIPVVASAGIFAVAMGRAADGGDRLPKPLPLSEEERQRNLERIREMNKK